MVRGSWLMGVSWLLISQISIDGNLVGNDVQLPINQALYGYISAFDFN